MEVIDNTHEAAAGSPPAISSRMAGKMKYSAVASYPPTNPASTAARIAVEDPANPGAPWLEGACDVIAPSVARDNSDRDQAS
jgi:hypothetical protein